MSGNQKSHLFLIFSVMKHLWGPQDIEDRLESHLSTPDLAGRVHSCCHQKRRMVSQLAICFGGKMFKIHSFSWDNLWITMNQIKVLIAATLRLLFSPLFSKSFFRNLEIERDVQYSSSNRDHSIMLWTSACHFSIIFTFSQLHNPL